MDRIRRARVHVLQVSQFGLYRIVDTFCQLDLLHANLCVEFRLDLLARRYGDITWEDDNVAAIGFIVVVTESSIPRS